MSEPVVRVGVGVFVLPPATHQQQPQRVLIGRRLGSLGANKLALPGGHLELSESWAECAIREVREETALVIQNVRCKAVINNPCMDGNASRHYITIFMVGDVAPDSPELANLEPEKCESWAWTTWDDLVRQHCSDDSVFFDPLRRFINHWRVTRPPGADPLDPEIFVA
eukprot:gnl/Spiro4/21751_TR10657_c0_g1_i1.p1 gnl/Spiro4/21751_TR10657_c0_g1~~gnl/Spiro4/21751_TR10657_c0_g1_i1.p1  ORF type:complete len:168 (-),score=24.86 gnl/Spiro4/21751_TR10657_c0_g1_i1:20-523(-)